MYPAQVTVILPVFNGEATLTRAIESILHQSYPHWKLLLLDDGSTDSTLEIAHSFQDTRITVVSDGLHMGIVKRLNQGVKLADTPYIARMDADDFSLPQRLELQLLFLENNPRIDLVGTAIRRVSPTGGILGEHIFPSLHSGIVSRPWLKTISIAHPTWCGRSKWFQQWPYRDFPRNEDQELLLRAASSSTYSNLAHPLLEYTVKNKFSQKLQTRLGWIHSLVDFHLKRNEKIVLFLGTLVVFVKIFTDLVELSSRRLLKLIPPRF